MVRKKMVLPEIGLGDVVIIPWGIGEVRGRAVEIYGVPPKFRVVVELTPELTGFVCFEPTTVVWPIEFVRLAETAA
jgi:hypothetical protein